MIDFDDAIYGKVMIFEHHDVNWEAHDFPSWHSVSWHLVSSNYQADLLSANIVAYREVHNERVKIFKHRYGSCNDSMMEQFILSYRSESEKIVTEIFEPINDRYEILDL